MITPSHILPLAQPGALMDGVKSFLTPMLLSIETSMATGALPLALAVYPFVLAKAYDQWRQKAVQPMLESSLQEYRHLFASNPSLEAEWKETGLLYLFKSEGFF